MPMFDIEDSKDVELTNNKTSSDVMAKIKNVDGLVATGNEAGIKNETVVAEDDIVELKPNVCGFGLNLRAMYRKLKGYIK